MIKNTLMNKDTQRQIAEKIGISEGMVSLMFAGKRQPSIKVAKRIAKIYKLDLNTIYDKEV
jgi:transcriptional regulator with XRE-family HTH domain|tara:strand:+ start:460 stop:642 length:183 start_codon:yes stop_codon:yes gene_type:complete